MISRISLALKGTLMEPFSFKFFSFFMKIKLFGSKISQNIKTLKWAINHDVFYIQYKKLGV